MLWGIKIWQIIFWGIAFPIIAATSIAHFQELQDRSFEPPKFQLRQLSAARDLKGDWVGTSRRVIDIPETGGSHYCDTNINFVLHITGQQDNTISGTLTDSYLSNIHEVEDGHPSCADSVAQSLYPVNVAFSGTITSSSIEINTGSNEGNFSGSFTSNTMRLDSVGEGSVNLNYLQKINLFRHP